MDALEESITEPVDAELSSSEDAGDLGLLGATSTAAESDFSMGDKKVNTNSEHNKKERERRKVLKEAVTQLREQLRKPTRKPVTIKVLEAAQNEIKELKAQEESSTQRLETLKKKESHLQWKIEELRKELSRLPDCEAPPDLVPDTHPAISPTDTSESCDSSTLSQQPTAPCVPPPALPPAPSLPAAYIIAHLPQTTPTPLMNFSLTPPTITPSPASLFQHRLVPYPPHAAATFLQAFPLPPVAATPPHINHQGTTHFVPPHSLTSAGTIRPHPFPLPTCPLSTPNPIAALGVDSTYMMPARTFLTPQLLRPPALTTGFSGLIGQGMFPQLRSSDHLRPPNPIGMPLAEATTEETALPLRINPFHFPTSISVESPRNPAALHRAAYDRHHHHHDSSNSLVTTAHPTTTSNITPAEVHDTSTSIISVEEEPTRNPTLHTAVPVMATFNSAVEVAALDSVEDNDKRENISVAAVHSLPDDDDSDTSDNYSWGRKKKRKKKRQREECQSSSESESEGSCSSSRQIRICGERFRTSSSRSSGGSTEPSKRSKGEKTNNKKCSTSGNKFCGIPPLLKVSAAEFHWPSAGDNAGGSRSMELISECEITVSANASYSPDKQHRPPPCPTLERLPLQTVASDSSITTTASTATTTEASPSSRSSSSTGEDGDLGWTEAIIEQSMNNLKKKFGELQSPCLDLNGGCSNYGHQRKTVHPILLT